LKRRIPSGKIKFSVTWKLAILAAVAITLVNVYSYAVAIPIMENKQAEERQEQVRVGVQTAHGMLQEYQSLEATGVLTTGEAQQYALEAMSGLTYGAGNEGYFDTSSRSFSAESSRL